MRASKSWNFDLEKPIEPIKMDSCVIFADHCSKTMVEISPAVVEVIDAAPQNHPGSQTWLINRRASRHEVLCKSH